MTELAAGKVIKKYLKSARLTPARMIFFGFVVLILLGTLILMLPVSAKSGGRTGFTDALFTATSSVCVTGLVVEDTNTYWSLFGKIVILILIQIGALGIMSVVTLLSAITGRNLGLSQRMALKESISNYSLENIVVMFKNILKVTFIIEGIGAIITSIQLIPIYGLAKGIGKGIFHSVSSFCNAGFDVFGTDTNKFTSLTGFSGNFMMLMTTSVLIVVGGLGFIVWDDVVKNRKFSRFTLHTKIVLVMTAILIAGGTIAFLLFESEQTLKGLPLPVKLLNSFFQSVSARTAGFNTISFNDMNIVTSLIMIVLMFIGAAPGSTAGGIKTTTFFVLIVTVISFLKGRTEVQAFKKRIAADIINKAVSIFLLGLTLIMVTTIVLLANDEGSLRQTLFEAVSAFGTVGLSTGITPDLCDVSKYQLIVTMLLGRVGIITAFAAFTSMRGKDKITYRCPEGKITVG
ncbi:MAG: potassium transporter TrkG [Anaerocolumna sp.]